MYLSSLIIFTADRQQVALVFLAVQSSAVVNNAREHVNIIIGIHGVFQGIHGGSGLRNQGATNAG